jgi:ATP-binding cassette subfamily B protein
VKRDADTFWLSVRGAWPQAIALFAPYWRWQLAIFLSMVASSTFTTGSTYLTRFLIDNGLGSHKPIVVAELAALMAAMTVVAQVLTVFQSIWMTNVTQLVMRDLRIALVTRLHALPIEFFNSRSTGAIINRALNDVENLDVVLAGTVAGLASALITVILTLWAMLLISPLLTSIAVLVLPISHALMYLGGDKIYKLRKQNRRVHDNVNALLHDALSASGVLLAKIFGREDAEVARFREMGERLRISESRMAYIAKALSLVVAGATALSALGVWIVGTAQVSGGHLSVGALLAFVMLASRLYGPAAALSATQTNLAGSRAILDRIGEYLAMPLPQRAELPSSAPISGPIQMSDVSFGYATAPDVIRQCSLTIPERGLVAIVGPSGSGKTTIASLLMALFDDYEGEIRIGDCDYRLLSPKAIRKHVSVVPQEPFLLADTIAANLRYANPQLSDTELWAALDAVELSTWVRSLSTGLETVVGNRGGTISGGQRQRLAIARAMIHKPPVLILDEATSALDAIIERTVLQNLLERRQQQATVVIAHRLAVLTGADDIVVLEEGRTVHHGRHLKLLRSCVLYRELYENQLLPFARVD